MPFKVHDSVIFSKFSELINNFPNNFLKPHALPQAQATTDVLFV